ncbi:MAG: carbohydrate ABC transporter permease, partial [Lachnospiraceae bacterium]
MNKTRSKTPKESIKKHFLLFMGPVLAAFIIGFVWPFIQGIYLSFCKFRLIKDAEFIGFSNYGKAFSDASFRYSFVFTAVFAVVSLVLINVLAFTVAYILTQNIKG